MHEPPIGPPDSMAQARRDADARTAFLLGLLAFLPLFVWWLGWFPGLMSSDSIDQLTQARDAEFTNFHPAFHTMYLWLLTFGGSWPGLATLLQAAAMAALLGLVARRLVEVGVPLGVSVAAAVAVAALPTVSATTITIWKDVPYTLALLWVFSELLMMVRGPGRFWAGRWGPVRLGVGLSLVWLFRLNGFLTVLVVLAALGIKFRSKWRRVAVSATVVAAAVLLVLGPLYAVLSVDRRSISPAAVFVPDVAASLTHEPGNFSESELQYLRTIAPLEVWTSQYSCLNSVPLTFDPDFDSAAIRGDQWRFASLVIRTALRDPDTVLGHRLCQASYLFWPPQDRDTFFFRPPFAIPPNAPGSEREPLSDRAFSFTKSMYSYIEPPNRLWFTWRPALMIWAGALTYSAIAWRRRLRALLPIGLLGLAQFLNVAATAPAQEFRSAFGLYVMAALSLPLLWLVARPGEAVLGRDGVRDGARTGDESPPSAPGGPA